MAYLIQYSTDASSYDGPFGGGHPWLSSGMGYIIKTDSGAVIAIDGGHPVDGKNFLELIKEASPEFTVDAWILTHPHIDHYGAIRDICEKYSDSVKVKKIFYRFPEEFVDSEGGRILDVISEMEAVLSVTNAEKHEPKCGESVSVADCDIKFFFAPEDVTDIHGKNPLSLVFSLTVGDKKMIFTGDSSNEIMDFVWETYGDELKCDILQLPHHGLCDTGHNLFYKSAAASTVLIPTMIAGYKAMDREEYCPLHQPSKKAEKAAKRVYKSFEGTSIIEL